MTGVLIAAALVAPASSQAQASAAPTKADVQKLLDARDEARNKGDWSAYGRFFTADATVTNSDGKSQKGRAQVEQTARENFGTGVYKGARMKALVESVESVAPNVAVADMSFEISNIAGGGSRKGRTTAVLVKGSDGWKIAATRSMVPTPAGAVRTSQ
jgi:uncharacterized protein (TIGR02246 family)